MVRNTLVGEFGLRFTFLVRCNVLLCYKVDFFLEFPGAMVVVEALPFAKVFHVTVDGFPVRDDAFNIAIGFEILLLSFLFEQESLTVFLRYPWSIEARLPYFVCLDVIVNPFEAPEALQEFICLVGVVEVGEIFPLDVKSLSNS